MNNEIKQSEIEIKKSVEILLAGMAFNSNIPITYIEDKTSDTPKMVGRRITQLPMGEVNYIETMDAIADMSPRCNELLLAIGIDLSTSEYQPELFHAEVVKYLANNDIMYKYDEKQKNWIINFPEEIVNNLLTSQYRFFLEGTRDFFNYFYNQNICMNLRKLGDRKAKEFIKA